MKILDIQQTRDADLFTITHEPVSPLDLMERAAKQLAEAVREEVLPGKKIIVFCGPGNNGGDGLAMARLLHPDYPLQVYYTEAAQYSPEFKLNLERLPVEAVCIHSIAEIKPVEEDAVLVDALFGSGLSRPLDGLYAELVMYLNRLPFPMISIDIPSGLWGEDNRENTKQQIIQADLTLAIQFPKLSFFLPESGVFVGEWTVLDIGISAEFIRTASSAYHYLVQEEAALLLHPRMKFLHKGNTGHAWIIAGNHGKSGAGILSAGACLKAGAGLVTLQTAAATYPGLMARYPEVMMVHDDSGEITNYMDWMKGRDAYAIGPGLGKTPAAEMVLKRVISEIPGNLVLDADALNILAEHPTWMAFLPAETILTPHPGEFDRLAGKSVSGWERLEKQRALSMKFNCYIVLKGAHSSISAPDGNISFNTTGNPGMATAGSGDVLTGIITGLLAQGYSPWDAARLAVYIHGLAGDIAVNQLNISLESLVASDLVEHLGKAFKSLWETNYKMPM